MSKADGNVAFKCTYNDGGEPGVLKRRVLTPQSRAFSIGYSADRRPNPGPINTCSRHSASPAQPGCSQESPLRCEECWSNVMIVT